MSLSTSTPSAKPAQAVLFDAYGTLFDVYSVTQLAEQLYPGFGHAISAMWRDKQIEYTRLVTTSNEGAHYQPFSVLTRAALVYTLKRLVDPLARDNFEARHCDAIAQLMAQYLQLTPFAENLAVLEQLKAQGVVTGILSNGDPGMLNAVVQSAGVGRLLDHVISVDEVRKFKTHPLSYGLGEQYLKLQASDIVFVSSNSWDALCATWFGYRTLWVNRARLPFEELCTQPERIGSDLRDVLPFFPTRLS
jgi:2-haloacid dehalogenase